MISVIMSTFREPIEYVRAAVDSIVNQTYGEIEFIIVVDDPKNTELISYLKKRAENDNRIRISINEKNCGLPESLNRAIKMSKGEFIARMDADDISELDRLECELRYLQEKELDLVGCNILDIDEKGEITNPSGSCYPIEDKVIKEYLKTNSAIPHPTWLAKREVYIKSGMYQLFLAAQDYDFLIRAAIDGKKFGNIRDCKLRYRINSQGISATKKVLQKTIQYYIRINYEQGKKSSPDEFNKFLYSEAGKKKQEDLRKYYEKSAYLKERLADRKYVSFAGLGIMTLIFSGEGRWVILSILKERLLRLRYKSSFLFSLF